MKLITLLTLLPIISQSERILYDSTGTGIGSYSFEWSNLGGSGSTETGPDEQMITIIEDGSTGTGAELINPDGTWTNGLTGTFTADNFNPGTGNKYYKLSALSISLITDCALNTGQTSVSASRYAPNNNAAQIIGDLTAVITTSDDLSGTVYTYTATIPSTGLAVDNVGGIKFDVNMALVGSGCEGYFYISELLIEAEAVVTDEPTISPTTKDPTPAPTTQCIGEITWGDPHFKLMSFNTNARQLNYQGLGWFYYLFPCNYDDYNNWPFFLLSKHNRCYWQRNPKGCIGANRLVLNTKPNPWIFSFFNAGGDVRFEIVQYGTDESIAANSIDVSDIKNDYTSGNPLIINYDDGGNAAGTCGVGTTACQQKGTLKIYYENGQIVLELNDVLYKDYPRTCDKGEGENAECGEYKCEGKVIEMRNSGSWTVFSCPSCLRNIACGLMGKYTRGDCTSSQLTDSNNACNNVLQGSDGTVYKPPNSDAAFYNFGETWKADAVKTAIESNLYSEVNGLRLGSLPHSWAIKGRNGNELPLKKLPQKDGRIAPDLQVVDTGYYDGLCKNDMTKIQTVNETCRQNTVVKYERCCKEIGICPILWKACIEDLCSCTAPSGNNTFTDQQCLDTIIHESMNATCSWDALWPTATPTATPTKTPTGLVAGLPRGTKAMDLIWLYLIFVIVFVLIAGGAYWYYRKKNKTQVEFPQDEEEAERQDMEMGGTNIGVYS